MKRAVSISLGSSKRDKKRLADVGLNALIDELELKPTVMNF